MILFLVRGILVCHSMTYGAGMMLFRWHIEAETKQRYSANDFSQIWLQSVIYMKILVTLFTGYMKLFLVVQYTTRLHQFRQWLRSNKSGTIAGTNNRLIHGRTDVLLSLNELNYCVVHMVVMEMYCGRQFISFCVCSSLTSLKQTRFK